MGADRDRSGLSIVQWARSAERLVIVAAKPRLPSAIFASIVSTCSSSCWSGGAVRRIHGGGAGAGPARRAGGGGQPPQRSVPSPPPTGKSIDPIGPYRPPLKEETYDK